jgi:hypothetical protein
MSLASCLFVSCEGREPICCVASTRSFKGFLDRLEQVFEAVVGSSCKHGYNFSLKAGCGHIMYERDKLPVLDSLSEEVGPDETRRAQGCYQNTDAIIIGPDSTTFWVQLVFPVTSITNIVDGEVRVDVAWVRFQELKPALTGRGLGEDVVFRCLGCELCLVPRYVNEDFHDLTGDFWWG